MVSRLSLQTSGQRSIDVDHQCAYLAVVFRSYGDDLTHFKCKYRHRLITTTMAARNVLMELPVYADITHVRLSFIYHQHMAAAMR